MGALPFQNGGQNMQNFGRFLPLLTFIANISGTGQDIENRKDVISSDSFRVRRCAVTGVSLAGLILSFIACFILLVIAP